MGVAKEQARQADEMDYLMSRMQDKDATIERLVKQLTATKRLLLRTYDWVEYWEKRMPAEDAFDSPLLASRSFKQAWGERWNLVVRGAEPITPPLRLGWGLYIYCVG